MVKSTNQFTVEKLVQVAIENREPLLDSSSWNGGQLAKVFEPHSIYKRKNCGHRMSQRSSTATTTNAVVETHNFSLHLFHVGNCFALFIPLNNCFLYMVSTSKTHLAHFKGSLIIHGQ